MSNHKFKKKYGQNFLNDAELLRKIEEVTNVSKKDNVLEIGVGQGFLTSMLLKNAKTVTAYEIDDDLIPYINRKYSKYDNFKLIHQDILEAKIEPKDSSYKVVANIPYYITGPIIQKMIDNISLISEIYLMVQKEVGYRLTGKNNRDNGVFTHIVNYYFNTSYLFTVDKSLFTPIPKVDSAFIKLEVIKDNEYEKLIDFKTFEKYINICFRNKRKTLMNNLKDFDKNIITEYLLSINKPVSVRAEELTTLELINLINRLEG